MKQGKGRYAYKVIGRKKIVISFKTGADCEKWLKDEGYRQLFNRATRKAAISKFGPIVNTIEPVHAMWEFDDLTGMVKYYAE